MARHPVKSQARRQAVALLGLCGLLHACAPGGDGTQPACSPAAQVEEVAEGIFVRPGHPAVVFEGNDIANIGFIVGTRCVAVVDTGGSLAEGQALDCAIRGVTPLPVCYVINTHVHPDHLLGNAAFSRSGVTFVGHEKLPRALALRGDVYLERASGQLGRPLGPSSLIFPERLVEDAVELDIGARLLIVSAHQSAHTDHDISVLDKRTGTAFLGDLVFLEHLPVIDGSINGWIDELERLRGESFANVVSGHGPVTAHWPAAAAPTAGYLQALRQQVRAVIARGDDLVSAQDTVNAGRGDQWTLFDRYHRRNVGAAYAELEWED